MKGGIEEIQEPSAGEKGKGETAKADKAEEGSPQSASPAGDKKAKLPLILMLRHPDNSSSPNSI